MTYFKNNNILKQKQPCIYANNIIAMQIKLLLFVCGWRCFKDRHYYKNCWHQPAKVDIKASRGQCQIKAHIPY
jgi:hypothetical protein